MKKLGISILCVFALCACGSMNDNSDGTSNQTNEEMPQTPESPMANSTIDDFMMYLKDQGVEYMDAQPLENMNITAHEGRSFMIDGNPGYLYRVDSSDDLMKKLLADAKETGMIDATQNGEQKPYTAHVNGDYLLIYDKANDMNSVVSAFPNFNPMEPYTGNATNPTED